MVNLDKALNGLITEIRRSGKFSGHAEESYQVSHPEFQLERDSFLSKNKRTVNNHS
jgi:hypothetical protein